MQKDRYFLILNLLLFTIILIGFAPSFFLRPINYTKPLPAYLIIHGITSTLWFVIAILQSFWVHSKNLSLHRRFGTAFSLTAPIISLSGLWVVYDRIQIYFTKTVENTPEVLEFQLKESMLIWGDIMLLISFVVFVYLGYQNRRNILAHKRWMIVASLMLVPPALVRIGKFSFLQIGSDPGASGSIISVIGTIGLLGSMMVYDRRRLKKIHKVSWAGMIWYFSMLVIATILMRSGLGVSFLEIFG